jgi:putative tryptophan/tyrosine transport system substrate-binding protein
LAADLIQRRVAMIVTVGGDVASKAANAATSTIPIVFNSATDPVTLGLVASLSRPGGNITGLAQLSGVVVTKRLGLLHELVPNARAFGVIANPDNPGGDESLIKDVRDAARPLGRPIFVANAKSEREFDAAFASLAGNGVEALIVLPSPIFTTQSSSLVATAAHYRIAAIYHVREIVVAGGLMSYGSSLADMYRQSGIYAGRILKGEKSADLPVMQPTKFEFVINLKTANALGLTIPETLLATADEVIQ